MSNVRKNKKVTHRSILRLHEAKATSAQHKLDKNLRNFYVEAENWWTRPDYETKKQQGALYWSYAVEKVVHGISQEDFFLNFFLADCINVNDNGVKVANVVMICVGRSGKGKSFTLFGLDGPYENRGLVLRIISCLFQLKAQYDSCSFVIKISVIELHENVYYDLLETPKLGKHENSKFNLIEVESEKYASDLLFQLQSKRKNVKFNEYTHHGGTFVLQISVDIASRCSRDTHCANIYLVDLEAFDHVHVDNVKTLENLNSKYFRFQGSSNCIVKVIGTTNSTNESVRNIKSLLYQMKVIKKSISSFQFEESEYDTDKDNLNSLKDKIYEIKGIMKLSKDRRINLNPNVIRETNSFIKRLLSAYVNNKVEEMLVINLNIATDVRIIFDACKELHEPLRLNMENDKLELAKQIRLEHLKKLKPLEQTPSLVETINNTKQESLKLKQCRYNSSDWKLKLFSELWCAFLEINPGLSLTLDYYRKEHDDINKMLNEKLKAFTHQSTADLPKDDIRMEVLELKTHLELIRKKVFQLHKNYQPIFESYCKENKRVALPNEIDMLDFTTLETIPQDPVFNVNSFNNLEDFHKSLIKIIRNSRLFFVT